MVKHWDYFEDKIHNLTFKDPVTNKKGYPSINFNCGDEDFKFQLSKPSEVPTKAPFGISIYIEPTATQEQKNAKLAEVRKNLDLSFKNARLVSMIQRMDEIIILKAIEKRESWFKPNKKGEFPNEDQIRNMYTSSLSVDEKYDPRLRTKVNVSGKNALKVTEVVIDKGRRSSKPLNPKELELKEGDPGFECISVTHGSQIWFGPKQFGPTFNTCEIVKFTKIDDNVCNIDLGEDAGLLENANTSVSSSSSSLSSPLQNTSATSISLQNDDQTSILLDDDDEPVTKKNKKS